MKQYKHLVVFYVLSIVIPWILWFTAGHLSYKSNPNLSLITILGLIGLSTPMVVAFWLIYKDSNFKEDLLWRLTSITKTKPIYLLLSGFLMLGSILLAQAISLFFGYSVKQFIITGHYTFTSGILPVWFLLIIAPVLEELGWHTYGIDVLRNKFNLFYTSIIFAFYWGIWHMPLSSINHYYQSNLVKLGWIHSVNFLISIFPFVIIMNWLYYKSHRNIIIPVVFHITAGYFNEIFATNPDSKIIQTIILVIVAVFIILINKEFFFDTDFKDEFILSLKDEVAKGKTITHKQKLI